MSILQVSEIALPPSNTPSPSGYNRVDEVWFQDGTLIIEAEGSLFRVYGGLLGAESPVFHDMLDFPQPDGAESIDGCPLVHLSDSAPDVNCFLKALFDYKFFPPLPNATNFDTIVGILRLSKKYQVDQLHKRALAHLSSGFPMSAGDYPGSASWILRKSDNTRVILLARELSIDWVLPVAFYGLCTAAIDPLLNGVYIDGVRMKLSPKDKLICLEQYVLLRGSASSDITDFLWHHPKLADA
ncbi:hypothetical protein C8R44DRAFT_761047 [Mycena epipterygia]|nr:hypothetical protein C8R44DRAFT_761047 [Mycena epipterygia]